MDGLAQEQALFTTALFSPIIIVVIACLASLFVRRGWLVVAGALVVTLPLGVWFTDFVNGMGRPPSEDPKCGMFLMAVVAIWMAALFLAALFGIATLVMQRRSKRGSPSLPE